MLILGLLIILGAAALTVGVVIDGSEAAKVEIFGATFDTTVAGVFFTGAGTMLLFLIGVWLLTASMGRARRKRGERKEVRRRQRDSVKSLEAERTQLRAENERLSEELGHRPDTTTTTTTDGTPVTGPATSTRTGSTVAGAADPAGSHARTDTDLRETGTTAPHTHGERS